MVCFDPESARTRIVDDMVHGPAAVEVDAEWLNKVIRQVCWRNDSRLHRDLEIAEVVVNSYAVRHVLLDVVGHTVTGVPCVTIVSGNIVRQLHLQEVTLTALTIPLDLILQCMLRRPAEHCDIVAVHHQPMITRVVTGKNQTLCCVICTPQPHIVANGVTIVDLQHHTSLHSTCCLVTDTNEDILQSARI